VLSLNYQDLCSKFDLLNELPVSLKSEVSLFINSDLIQKVNFFQFADPSFILEISQYLKPKLCLTDNYVMMKGEMANHMYFIKSGIVEIIATDNKTAIAFQSEGTYFGEIGVILDMKRTCSVKSRTASIFYYISKKKLLSVLEKHPLQFKFLRGVAK
jgi:CRP-like cAMP-binding protein